MRSALLVVVALLGCDRDRPAPPPPPSPPAPVPAAAPPIDAAEIDAAPPPDAAPIILPKPSSGWIDKPSWPAGDQMTLTWLVYPDQLETYRGMENTPMTPLQLEATLGNVTRVLTFEKQLGQLEPSAQAWCAHGAAAYPLERGEVAKIAFYEGGAGGILVRRAGAGVVELVDWFLTDGACDDKHGHIVACARQEKVVARMHVPRNATFTEMIVMVNDDHGRYGFECLQ